MNSDFCPLDLDTHCQGCSGNGARPAGQSLGPGARARARPHPREARLAGAPEKGRAPAAQDMRPESGRGAFSAITLSVKKTR